MKSYLVLGFALTFLVACASNSPQEPAAIKAEESSARPKIDKDTCGSDLECGEGGMCIKPEAADYGFCI